jgi:hypothetical protein
LIYQNCIKRFISVLVFFSLSNAFSGTVKMENKNPEMLFIQLPDGRYEPFVKHKETHYLETESKDSVPLTQKKESLIGKIRKFFVTPFNFTVPVLGNIKKLYYQCEYQVTCAAQEFYQEVFPQSSFISKEQTVAIAQAYFFNVFGRLLTPSGISDAIISRILSNQIPIIAYQYHLSNSTAFFAQQALYSLYTIITKEIDVPWYLFAFLYHVGMRSEINNYFKINGYAEMILLALCAPKMVQYLS